MLSLITLIQTKVLFIWLQVGCRAYILHLPLEYTRLGRARGKLRRTDTDTACYHSFVFVNWASVTPLPIAAVDETPPVTVFNRLST